MVPGPLAARLQDLFTGGLGLSPPDPLFTGG
jgi:hypothetical protein